jgi:putative DNA primase/helicase
MNFQEQTRGHWRQILSELIGEEFVTGKHGACPLCGGTDRFRFDNKDGLGTYYCNQCGAGTGITLVCKYLEVQLSDAWKTVIALLPSTEAEQEKPKSDHRNVIKFLCSSSVPAGDSVHEYLRNRGILVVPIAIRQVKFVDYSDPENKSYQAMICTMQKNKRVTGIHLTLVEDGKKAPIPNPRRLFKMSDGALKGSSVHLFPDVWAATNSTLLEQLEIPKEQASIVTGEGIETTLSAMVLAKSRSLNYDGIDIIASDNDFKYGGQAAAYALAYRLSRTRQVKVIVPERVGSDWNDYLMSLPPETRKQLWNEFVRRTT